ncbi:serine protein kinase RIO [Methanotorris formicicus]|uniref:non-specific serine/threonine protein kinase n=1 Tax=Methanotorris formicicus Mc-S-70 TaxID=647171 RepID=H1KZJ3_9EURY|nr:serine protein kinase RIO [Methanotorris formicicus]EHP85886.1 Non-specific serine/threonine protein kinase [Methanotorris formicicus Mc-S-70]
MEDDKIKKKEFSLDEREEFELDREYQKKVIEREKKFFEELKTKNEVFDKRTLMVLYSLLAGRHIDEFIGIVSSGKEAVVFSAKKGRRYRAVKIYRVATCDFKTMYKYIQGDPRFHLRKSSRRQIIHAWVEKEFRNLRRAGEVVNTPKAILRRENVLLMELVGKRGIPAPRLKDVEVDYEKFYKMIIQDMKKLYCEAELVHGDLSEYNILVKDDKPVYIDFSQSVVTQHPLSKALLIRDVKNICNFFRRKGVDCDYRELYKYITGEELNPIDEEIAQL